MLHLINICLIYILESKQLSNGDYAGIAGLAPIVVKGLPNAYKIANNYMNNVYRRGAEVAMRTSANPDPTNPIKLGLNNIKAAKQHGMSVQSFANRVLRNPSKYSAAMRKKANFAHNAAGWKH